MEFIQKVKNLELPSFFQILQSVQLVLREKESKSKSIAKEMNKSPLLSLSNVFTFCSLATKGHW